MKPLVLLLITIFLISCGRKNPPLPLEKSIPHAPSLSAMVEGKSILLLIELPTKTQAGHYLTTAQELLLERKEINLEKPSEKVKAEKIKLKPKLHSASPLIYFIDEKVKPRRLYLYRGKLRKDFLVESPFSEEVEVFFRYPPKAPSNLVIESLPNGYHKLSFQPPSEDLSGSPLELPLWFVLEERRGPKITQIELRNNREYLFTQREDKKVCFRVQANITYFNTEIKGPFSREVCLY